MIAVTKQEWKQKLYCSRTHVMINVDLLSPDKFNDACYISNVGIIHCSVRIIYKVFRSWKNTNLSVSFLSKLDQSGKTQSVYCDSSDQDK